MNADMNNRRLVFAVFSALLTAITVLAPSALSAAEVTMRLMPAPPAVEADYAEELAAGWDLSLGYGRLWIEGTAEGALNGALAGVTYRGVLGDRLGFTAAPLIAGTFWGELAGFAADTQSLGSGFSFGSRILGTADSHNLVIFGGGLYAWGFDRADEAAGSYRIGSHLFGVSAGLKVRIVPTRKVSFTPFYVYMGGGGRYNTVVKTSIPFPVTIETTGGLGYTDLHLFGLDFNIYGISAKLTADLFRDEVKTFTVMIDVLRSVRSFTSD